MSKPAAELQTWRGEKQPRNRANAEQFNHSKSGSWAEYGILSAGQGATTRNDRSIPGVAIQACTTKTVQFTRSGLT